MASVVANDGSWAFLHTPKTAGTWVTAVLRQVIPTCRTDLPVPDHHRRDDLLERGFLRPGAYTFAFVRHPLPWYVSCWRHLSTVAAPNHARWSPDVEVAINAVLDAGPFWSSRMLCYAQDVDFVGRHEQVRQDLARVLARIAPDVSARRAVMAPRRLPSRQGPPPNPPLSRQLVQRIYKLDGPTMERFGYTSDRWRRDPWLQS